MPLPFHLAIPVYNLEECKDFYIQNFGCSLGRTSENWIDLNFYNHQLVLHKVADNAPNTTNNNPVDGKEVPVPHFGVVLDWEEWHNLAQNIAKNNVEFVIEPYIRFEGELGEQATMFFYDPSGNAIEFKSFKNPDQLFAK